MASPEPFSRPQSTVHELEQGLQDTLAEHCRSKQNARGQHDDHGHLLVEPAPGLWPATPP